MLRAITIIIVIIISSVWVLSLFSFLDFFLVKRESCLFLFLSISLCVDLLHKELHGGAGHRTWSRHYFLFPLVPLSLLAWLPKDTASHHHHRHQNQQKYSIPN